MKVFESSFEFFCWHFSYDSLNTTEETSSYQTSTVERIQPQQHIRINQQFKWKQLHILVVLFSLASMCIVLATFGILTYVMKLNEKIMKYEEKSKVFFQSEK